MPNVTNLPDATRSTVTFVRCVPNSRPVAEGKIEYGSTHGLMLRRSDTGIQVGVAPHPLRA